MYVCMYVSFEFRCKEFSTLCYIIINSNKYRNNIVHVDMCVLQCLVNCDIHHVHVLCMYT